MKSDIIATSRKAALRHFTPEDGKDLESQVCEIPNQAFAWVDVFVALEFKSLHKEVPFLVDLPAEYNIELTREISHMDQVDAYAPPCRSRLARATPCH